MTIRCWQCGVEPEMVDVRTPLDPGPVLIPGRWPDGDHQHAERPPSPTELVAEGHRILHRILTS